MRILITGGAGFIGSRLALTFREDNPEWDIVVLDNLRRRGSEFNVQILGANRITFVHGDVRNKEDLEGLTGSFDLLIEASAEPSVLAGWNTPPSYVVQTNLIGALNCLEFVKQRSGAIVFLSTSRVYSTSTLKEIKLDETESRFTISAQQIVPAVSERGISEKFDTTLARSFYGTTKLAAEYLIQEYAHTYKINAIINRCGVIAGKGQFGKVDQGIFTHWAVSHHFGLPLQYTGFGGNGKQVRDILHPVDLYELIKIQISTIGSRYAEVYNVGGGLTSSSSLLEFTRICQEIVGHELKIKSNPNSPAVDVPLYISDIKKVSDEFGWRPQHSPMDIAKEIFSWLRENDTVLSALFTNTV